MEWAPSTFVHDALVSVLKGQFALTAAVEPPRLNAGARRPEKRKRAAVAPLPPELALAADARAGAPGRRQGLDLRVGGAHQPAAESADSAPHARGGGGASVAAAVAALRGGTAQQRRAALGALRAAAASERDGWAAEWLAHGCLEVRCRLFMKCAVLRLACLRVHAVLPGQN